MAQKQRFQGVIYTRETQNGEVRMKLARMRNSTASLIPFDSWYLDWIRRLTFCVHVPLAFCWLLLVGFVMPALFLGLLS